MENKREPFGKEWRETMNSHTKEELIDYLKIVCEELQILKNDKYFTQPLKKTAKN